ncbi:MAG: hypothetical protein JO307_23125 [Bryobacterales bacterium]|nr:hypothetical protein [Bryobacterales bacterium]
MFLEIDLDGYFASLLIHYELDSAHGLIVTAGTVLEFGARLRNDGEVLISFMEFAVDGGCSGRVREFVDSGEYMFDSYLRAIEDLERLKV